MGFIRIGTHVLRAQSGCQPDDQEVGDYDDCKPGSSPHPLACHWCFYLVARVLPPIPQRQGFCTPSSLFITLTKADMSKQYLDAIWKVINFDEAAKRYDAAVTQGVDAASKL